MVGSVVWSETPAGEPAWHVSRYREVKTLMEDGRLVMNHPNPEAAPWYTDSPMHRVMVRLAAGPIPKGGSDHEERAARRAAMTRIFAPRNLRHASPNVQATSDLLLDKLASGPPPVDLHEAYSIPLCASAVCELLGVPADDIALFRQWADDKDSPDMRRAMVGLRDLTRYVKLLVERRREEPGDDIVSLLLATESEDEFHVGRTTNLVTWMLGLGWQVAASAIDFGILTLLAHPDQFALLRADPSLADSATEEVLRHFNATAAPRNGLDRYAGEDIEIDGVLIKSGDMVLLDVPAANHDPEVFADPDVFDIRRSPNPHLTFGHGFYFCNFNKVARTEVSVGLSALCGRFPNLRLAVDPAELSFMKHPQSGPVRLPVAW